MVEKAKSNVAIENEEIMKDAISSETVDRRSPEMIRQEDCNKTDFKSQLLKTGTPVFKKILILRRYVNAISVRLAFMIEPWFSIYFTSCAYQNNGYLAMFIGCAVIFIDGLYVIFKRKGHDYYW
jgi:hypothetical protein